MRTKLLTVLLQDGRCTLVVPAEAICSFTSQSERCGTLYISMPQQQAYPFNPNYICALTEVVGYWDTTVTVQLNNVVA
jgi:hypothetical protein